MIRYLVVERLTRPSCDSCPLRAFEFWKMERRNDGIGYSHSHTAVSTNIRLNESTGNERTRDGGRSYHEVKSPLPIFCCSTFRG